METNTNIKRSNSFIPFSSNHTTNIKKAIAFTFLISNLGFSQQDKILHFSAGSAISGTTYYLFKDNKNAFWYSLGAGTIAGIAKETYDIKRTGFDNKDIAATIAGSITSNLIIYAITKAKKRRKSKRLHD